MPERCRACAHPKRVEIDRALMEKSRSVPALATVYGLSRAGLQRHFNNHLRVSVQALAESNNLLAIVKMATNLYEHAEAAVTLAETMLQEEGTTPRGLQALSSSLREVRSAIELMSRLVTTESDTTEEEARNQALDALILEQLQRLELPELPAGSQIEDAEIV